MQKDNSTSEIVDFQNQHLDEAIVGQILQNRFKVISKLAQGRQGKIYKVIDLKSPSPTTPLVIKISENYESIAHEIKVLRKVHKYASNSSHNSSDYHNIPICGIASLVSYGVFIGQNLHSNFVTSSNSKSSQDNKGCMFGYFIMPQYEMSLDDFLIKCDYGIQPEKVFTIMIQIFKALKLLHLVGYNHNDIKPNNVMIDGELNVTLIDLGFAASLLDSEKKHKECSETTYFKGNMLYSSVNQMQLLTTSRKDDLQSACYMMFYMLNAHNFPLIDESWTMYFEDEVTKRQKYCQLKEHKKMYSLTKQSQHLPYLFLDSIQPGEKELPQSDLYMLTKKEFFHKLGQVGKEIDKLSFKSKPNYDMITEHLTKCHELFVKAEQQFADHEAFQKSSNRIDTDDIASNLDSDRSIERSKTFIQHQDRDSVNNIQHNSKYKRITPLEMIKIAQSLNKASQK